MPIGNGDLAANVWVEPNGDLVFYVSKSDAWSGNGRLLKLGRVRVKTDPPLYTDGAEFKQELDLETGTLRVTSSLPPHPAARTSHHAIFWIDANRPVIHVEIESDELSECAVCLLANARIGRLRPDGAVLADVPGRTPTA